MGIISFKDNNSNGDSETILFYVRKKKREIKFNIFS